MTLPVLICVMGPTNAGKSTALAAMKALASDRIGLIEVGKALRAKYGDAYFNGQAAPQHTSTEAWQILLDGIVYHTAERCAYIAIDGQPRDYDQCFLMMRFPNPKIFVNLWAPLAVREARMTQRDANDPAKLELARARLHGDLPMLYELLSILNAAGQKVVTYRTDRPAYSPGVILTDAWEARILAAGLPVHCTDHGEGNTQP